MGPTPPTTITTVADHDVAMVLFTDEDAGYERWLTDHPDGFVINTERNPTRRYLRLHRAACRMISGTPTNGRAWTINYTTACGDEAELQRWARSLGGEASPCSFCVDLPRPVAGRAAHRDGS